MNTPNIGVHLGDFLWLAAKLELSLEQVTEVVRQRYASAMLAATGGNQCRAAVRLQVHRNTLRKILNQRSVA